MAEIRIRKLAWLAPLALVAAGMAACGDEDATATGAAPSAEASRGSDQHLYNQAAEITARSAVVGSDVHLYNQAAEITARSAAVDSDVHLYNQAADIAARSAVVGSDGAMPNVWEAGNRAAAAALGQG